MEIQLAERLGVSRTPIREAIRKLELEGLVLMIPRKGAEVAKISEKSLRDVLEVRRSLEELAIELACERITKEGIDELEAAQTAFCEALKTNDTMEMAETDEHYHDIIYNATGNTRLVQILNNLREQMYRYRLEYIKDASKRQNLVIEHDHIIRAIREHRIDEARAAIRDHIDNQEITIAQNIKAQELV
jgi:DNA-binding GntR family transcriptional regulator